MPAGRWCGGKKKLDFFFPAKKAVDERWEVVHTSPARTIVCGGVLGRIFVSRSSYCRPYLERIYLQGQFWRAKFPSETTYLQNNDTMAIFQFAHHDEHQYLPNGLLSCGTFQKGHPKDLSRAIR